MSSPADADLFDVVVAASRSGVVTHQRGLSSSHRQARSALAEVVKPNEIDTILLLTVQRNGGRVALPVQIQGRPGFAVVMCDQKSFVVGIVGEAPIDIGASSSPSAGASIGAETAFPCVENQKPAARSAGGRVTTTLKRLIGRGQKAKVVPAADGANEQAEVSSVASAVGSDKHDCAIAAESATELRNAVRLPPPASTCSPTMPATTDASGGMPDRGAAHALPEFSDADLQLKPCAEPVFGFDAALVSGFEVALQESPAAGRIAESAAEAGARARVESPVQNGFLKPGSVDDLRERLSGIKGVMLASGQTGEGVASAGSLSSSVFGSGYFSGSLEEVVDEVGFLLQQAEMAVAVLRCVSRVQIAALEAVWIKRVQSINALRAADESRAARALQAIISEQRPPDDRGVVGCWNLVPALTETAEDVSDYSLVSIWQAPVVHSSGVLDVVASTDAGLQWGDHVLDVDPAYGTLNCVRGDGDKLCFRPAMDGVWHADVIDGPGGRLDPSMHHVVVQNQTITDANGQSSALQFVADTVRWRGATLTLEDGCLCRWGTSSCVRFLPVYDGFWELAVEPWEHDLWCASLEISGLLAVDAVGETHVLQPQSGGTGVLLLGEVPLVHQDGKLSWKAADYVVTWCKQ
mmetsp:Transcript_32157/g.83382  ORF Transcript_32157/g.83382 Transcript_32157/m.83382 type:complete len:637 (+) Transcript_32157:38-1948(+)